MRRTIALVACALVAVALPAVAGAGAVKFSESWTNEPQVDLLREPGGGLPPGREGNPQRARGPIVFADGNTAMLEIGFTLVVDSDGAPKVFFAHAACGGE